ncbi:MAG: RNA-binding protein [Patescibacteria group bacterium]|nr:RNA-binding protein [Patescibacteria group bacterium]
MAKKLYFGGLSYSTTDDSLQAAVAPFGTVVSAKVIMDRETGRSRGFGFVEMSTDDEAMAVISGLDGKEIDGRAVRVSEARPQENGGGGGRGGFGGGRGGDRGDRRNSW